MEGGVWGKISTKSGDVLLYLHDILTLKENKFSKNVSDWRTSPLKQNNEMRLNETKFVTEK